MGKVNLLVKYCLINKKNEYNIKGILTKDELKFLDDENMMIINFKNNTLKRITEESEILFDFSMKTCHLLDKNSNNKVSFKIDLLEFSKNNNYFYVKYSIQEDENFEILKKIL